MSKLIRTFLLLLLVNMCLDLFPQIRLQKKTSMTPIVKSMAFGSNIQNQIPKKKSIKAGTITGMKLKDAHITITELSL